MGYTHYWRRPVNHEDRVRFAQLGTDIKRIIEASERAGVKVCGPSGVGEPEFNEQFIAFNGRAPKLDHESFVWTSKAERAEWDDPWRDQPAAEQVFDFTKTARKPYDAVVTACLLRAKHVYGGDVDVTSDGSWDEWAEGRALYAEVFGEEPTCPFTPEEVRA
jgi:hypothetical protein